MNKRNPYKRGKIKDFHVYLPEKTAQKLQQLANQECRTVSAQIEYLVKRALTQTPTSERAR